MVPLPLQENEATGSVWATRPSPKSTARGRSLSSLWNRRPLKEEIFRLELAIPARCNAAFSRGTVGSVGVGVDFGENRTAWTPVRSTSC